MAGDIKILNEDELRRIVGIDLPMIEVVEAAFAALSASASTLHGN